MNGNGFTVVCTSVRESDGVGEFSMNKGASELPSQSVVLNVLEDKIQTLDSTSRHYWTQEQGDRREQEART